MQGIKKRIAAAFICLCLFTSLLTGCEKRQYVLTTAFEKDELMRINSKSCFLPEMMLYLTTVQNRYEEVYGSKIWDHTIDGVPVSDKLKDMVLAKVAQVKVMM